MLKINVNDNSEVSGEVDGLYFVIYKDYISPLTPVSDIALIAAADRIAALEARLKEAEEIIKKVCYFLPDYELNLVRDIWGNTNTNLVQNVVREGRELLKGGQG